MTQRLTYLIRKGGFLGSGIAIGAAAVGLLKLAEWHLGW
jgi:hypothetical protein